MPLPFQLRNHNGHGVMEARPPPAQAPAPGARVSMFRRLLVRVSSTERVQAGDGKDERPPEETEVGSSGLDRMVLSFMEDTAAVESRPPPRGRCNCFNGSGHRDGSDDEEFDFLPSGHSAPSARAKAAAAGDALETLKGLVQSASVAERNLLADACRIAERCRKGGKKKADVRRAVADGLRALGHDAGVCKSRWDKTPSYPAGEHEYIDAAVSGEASSTARLRLIVEVDFRSEFEVARSTKAYRAVLQALPSLFVGTPDRLGKIVAVVAEAARQSLRKKGLHFPPWRKPEYMRAKWLSPHVRCSKDDSRPPVSAATFAGEFELRFHNNTKGHDPTTARDEDGSVVEQRTTVVVSPSPWRPVGPEARKKRPVAGLAYVL